jgi:hypothetical protein
MEEAIDFEGFDSMETVPNYAADGTTSLHDIYVVKDDRCVWTDHGAP